MNETRREKNSSILLIAILLFVWSVVFLSNSIQAASGINETINFQSKIVNTDGTNSAAACGSSCDFRFRIYDSASGGSVLWEETQSGVTLADGIMNVKLGSSTAFGTSIDFNDDSLYLQIAMNANTTAGDGPDSDGFEEVFDTPRLRLSAVPYAFNSKQIGGFEADGLLKSGESDVFEGGESGQLTIQSDLSSSDRSSSLLDILQQNDAVNSMNSNLVEIQQQDLDSTGSALYIVNEGTGDLIRLDDEDGDTSPFVVDADGNVGIGTSSPSSKLEVNNGTDAIDIASFEDNGTEVFGIRDGGDIDFNLNEAIEFRVENIDGSVTLPTCEVGSIGRQYYDTSDDNLYACIETAVGVYGWVALNTNNTNASKVVTVGTGGDYTSIAAAATYLNGLSGGIILLTPETHSVTTAIDIDTISIVGQSVGDSIISFTGNGKFNIQNSQFKSLSMIVDSGITSDFVLDVKGGATDSSLLFEYIALEVGGGKFLLGSTEVTAPVINARFVSTFAPSQSVDIINKVASSGLDASSIMLLQNQCCTSVLNFEDWNVKVAGSINVNTTGTITSLTGNRLTAFPEMNLQAMIDSLTGGGIIELLPGVFNITEPLIVSNDNIEIIGDGNSSIIRASGFTGIDETTAAIHLGAPDGTAPIDGVELIDFKVEVDTNNIHGIRAAGGSNIRLDGVTVEKISGASGTGVNSRVGILITDGASTGLNGVILKSNYVLGSPGNYFTDGIHLVGGQSYGVDGIWTYGNESARALVNNSVVGYVGRNGIVTIADNVFVTENNISLFGVDGGKSYGIFVGYGDGMNVSENLVQDPVSTQAVGMGIDPIDRGIISRVNASEFDNNLFVGRHSANIGFEKGIEIGALANTIITNSTISSNIVEGPKVGSTIAIDIIGESDNNLFSNNIIDGNANGWDDGLAIKSANSVGNVVRGGMYYNTANSFSDLGSDTLIGVGHHRKSLDPSVNDDGSLGYSVGTIWVNTNTDVAFICTDNTTGAAVWNEVGSSSGSSAPGAYGEMSVNANATAQAISGTYSKVTAYNTVGQFFNTTVDTGTDTITVGQDGTYLINMSLSFSGVNNATYEVGVAVNGTVQSDIVASRKLGISGDVGTTTVTGILNLSSGDVVDVRMKGTGATATIQYSNVVIFTSNAAGGAGATGDLDTVYGNDVGKVLDINDVLGLEFRETAGGDISFDLQSTGSVIFQDSDVTFLEISADGSYDYTLDVLDNPSYVITNLGTGDFRVNDENGDTTPFVINELGDVSIGSTIANAKLDITSEDEDSIRINAYGTSSGETGGLEFMELDINGSNYVGFKAPDDIAQDIFWVLPNADGSAGEVLYTNGSGELDWKLINMLADADNDTKIQVEEVLDEDRIRFDTAGFERMSIDSNGDVNIGISETAVLSEGFEVLVPPTGWTTGGDSVWAQDNTDFTEGANSASSDGALVDYQSSWIDVDYTLAQDGKLVFDWKVDSEAGYDYLVFCLDNDATCDVIDTGPVDGYTAIAGTVPWATVEVPLTAGAHSFRWLYGKDVTVSNGQDKGWVDNVILYEGSASGTANLFVAGNIGIGTNTPSTELHVEGNARITGLASCDIVYTDADGNLTCGNDQGAAFDVYDNAGGQSFTTTPITVNLDTIRRSQSNYTLGATDDVTVSSDGTYEMTYNCSVDVTTNARTNGRCWLERNTGAGFTEIDGSRCYTYNRTTTNGESSCSRTIISEMASGELVRLRAVREDGTGTLITIPDASSLTMKKIIAPGADLAEIYYTNDDSVEAGDVVVVDGSIYAGVKKSSKAYQSSLMGIISTQPGEVIGHEEGIEKGGRPVLVALSGRVPTKIDPESDPIEAGDYVTSSPNTGFAMKATKPGVVVGKALEAWDPESEEVKESIMVFVGTATYDPQDGVVYQDLVPHIDENGKSIDIGSEESRFDNIYASTINASNLQSTNYNLSEIYRAVNSSISAGDVISPKTDDEGRMVIDLTTNTYQDDVMGVVSTKPGITLSEWVKSSEEEVDDLSRPIALVGRVPVKVSSENGPIKAGDKLVPSSTPGYAMKACGEKYCQSGISIGVALEGFAEDQVGDSSQVEEEIDEVINELVVEISNSKEELETYLDEARDYETIITLEDELDVIDGVAAAIDDITTEKESDKEGEGRVMMFVNLTYFNGESSNQSVDVNAIQGENSGSEFITGTLLQQSVSGDDLQGGIYGSLIVDDLQVTGKAIFDSDIYVQGKINLSKDSVGIAKIREGDSRVEIKFEDSYKRDPIITISAVDFDGKYSLTNISGKGFSIELTREQNKDVVFNWHAFGTYDSIIVVSEGSDEDEIDKKEDGCDEYGDTCEVKVEEGGNDNGEEGEVVDESVLEEECDPNVSNDCEGDTGNPIDSDVPEVTDRKEIVEIENNDKFDVLEEKESGLIQVEEGEVLGAEVLDVKKVIKE